MYVRDKWQKVLPMTSSLHSHFGEAGGDDVRARKRRKLTTPMRTMSDADDGDDGGESVSATSGHGVDDCDGDAAVVAGMHW